MWYQDYDRRLADWYALRQRAQDLELQPCLQAIHDWWQTSPWRPYYLHWDDRRHWPDPWQLLHDNVFCDVARGLGLLYTVCLLERSDCADARLVLSEQGNLVLVRSGKYVLNWTQDTVVNIASQTFNIKTVLEPAVLESLIR